MTIDIFFGTDTGRTRRVAKLIAQKLGESAIAPLLSSGRQAGGAHVA